MNMKMTVLLLALAAAAPVAAIGLPQPARAQAAADEDNIRHLMRGTWDRPESPLTVAPVVVVGQFAVAGWIQGEMGGRALLHNKNGAWAIAFCSGDALKEAKTLAELGVPAADAPRLAAALAAAESKLDPKSVAMFARFAGLVKMDEHGNHPPGHGHEPKKEGHRH